MNKEIIVLEAENDKIDVVIFLKSADYYGVKWKEKNSKEWRIYKRNEKSDDFSAQQASEAVGELLKNSEKLNFSKNATVRV